MLFFYFIIKHVVSISGETLNEWMETIYKMKWNLNGNRDDINGFQSTTTTATFSNGVFISVYQMVSLLSYLIYLI